MVHGMVRCVACRCALGDCERLTSIPIFRKNFAIFEEKIAILKRFSRFRCVFCKIRAPKTLDQNLKLGSENLKP